VNPLNVIKEFNTEEPFGEPSRFTLDEAKQIYLDAVDEYEAGLQIARSWDRWEDMIKRVSFLKIVARWRQEKGLRNQSELLAMYWLRARKGESSAQHMLFTHHFKELKGKGPGRPKKVEVEDGTRKAQIIKEAEKHIKLAVNNERPDSKRTTQQKAS